MRAPRFLFMAVLLSFLSPATAVRLAPKRSEAVELPRPTARYGALPMRFEQNAGQVDAEVRFVARHTGATLFLTDEGATLAARGTVLRMRVAGGRTVPPRAEKKLATLSNYFVGDDPSKWRTDVPNFGQVVYPAVLDGVDLVYHGEEGQLEYDFVVAPGTRPEGIALEVSGAEGLSLSDDGALSIRTERGALVQPRPRVYQRGDNGERREIDAGYRLLGERSVGFEVAAYDTARELVIDPVLSYSTFFGGGVGGSSDGGSGVAVDASGSAYFTGQAASASFPTRTPFQATLSGTTDAFVAKLSPAGDSLVYSTYLGGSRDEQGNAVAVDTAGAAYVVGTTRSLNFPTQNPFQATNRSEPTFGVLDAFVTKLSPAGNALVYSTYLGGGSDDFGNAIAVDGAGRAHVAGDARSVNFPVQRPFQGLKGGGLSDVFVTRLSVAGNTLDYSTYVGGTGNDYGNGVALDAAGNVYLTGGTTSPNFPTKAPFQAALAGVDDAFVLKLAPTGDALVYSTYLGGTEGEGARAIAVDAAGSAYVTGQTSSPTDFPTQSPLQAATVGSWPDAFVTKLSPAGSTLVYSTYLGGSLNEEARGIVVDATGSAHVMGLTRSTDFPTMRPLQAAIAGGDDVFVTRLSPAGTAVFYSTYLGGGDDEEGAALALGGGSVYVVGRTASTNFPVQSAFQSVHGDGEYAAFVSKLSVPSPLLVPATPSVPPRGSVSFVASNGAGYTFSIETNASGGTVHPTTGAYVAGATGSVVDKVRVTELQGGTATATVTVGPGVSLAPTSASVLARQSVTFTATGGSDAGFAYSLEANGSGGVIDTATGVYTAGAAAPATDTVKAVDSLGNSSTANVAVNMPIADAGPDATDAGDAGPGIDAGSDAAVDASRDSGSLADAGEPGSLGGGGCGCRTSGGTGASGAAGLALSGLVAFVARRRWARG